MSIYPWLKGIYLIITAGGALTIPGIQIRYYDSRGDLAEIRIVTKQGANSALERGVTWLIGVQAVSFPFFSPSFRVFLLFIAISTCNLEFV